MYPLDATVLDMKKHFTYKSPKQIWRILISDTDKLVIETRDMNTKEVFFNCYDLIAGKKIFTDFQPEEKYWIGIETIYKDIIIFHKYPKPDLPGHKEIIAIDLFSQKKLWSNSDYTYLFAYNDRIYCFNQGFEDRYFFSLNYLDGNLLAELGTDSNKINSINREAENQKDWSVYIYPEVYRYNNEGITKIVDEQTKNIDLIGEVEYNSYKNLTLFSFHAKVFEQSFVNRFFAVDTVSGKVKLSEVLNSNTPSLLTDSFFVYKNFLILLKEKNKLMIYNLE